MPIIKSAGAWHFVSELRGPQAGKLFEKLVRDVEKLQAQQEQDTIVSDNQGAYNSLELPDGHADVRRQFQTAGSLRAFGRRLSDL